MESTTHEHPRRRRRVGALLLMACLTASLGAGAISLAIFTDSQAVTGNAFATGNVNIAATPATELFAVAQMMPGDEMAEELTVSNEGTGALRYAMSTTVVSGGALAGQLELTVWEKDGATCGDGGDLVVATTALSAAAFGSSTQGYDAGDRALAAGASEILCYEAQLPLSTGNAFQNTSTSVNFNFAAEQTANN